MVSIEDIIEEIVGEIVDEYEPPAPEPIIRLDDRTLEVDAKVRPEQLADSFNISNIDIEMKNNLDVDTVAGLVISLLGYVPKNGQVIDYQQLRFTVLDAEPRKINRLKVQLQSTPPSE